MATLTIRQLDDDVYDRLKRRAAANDRSVEAEVRQILGQSTVDVESWVAELRALHAQTVARDGLQEDSVALIRAIRDEE